MDKTKMILKQAGISISKAAELLGISRAGMYRVLVEGDLTFERWGKLYSILRASVNPQENRSSIIIKDLVEAHFQYKLIDQNPTFLQADFYSRHQPNPSDEYWIFAVEPLELHDLGYFQFMIRDEFSKNKFIVYFVGSSDTAKRLADAIEIRQLGLKKRFPAKIYIIETNAVWMAPHFSITDPRSTEPKGYALDLNGVNHVPIFGMAIEKIIHTLRNAGIGLPEEDDDEIRTENKTMFPKDDNGQELDEREYNQIYFKRHYPKIKS